MSSIEANFEAKNFQPGALVKPVQNDIYIHTDFEYNEHVKNNTTSAGTGKLSVIVAQEEEARRQKAMLEQSKKKNPSLLLYSDGYRPYESDTLTRTKKKTDVYTHSDVPSLVSTYSQLIAALKKEADKRKEHPLSSFIPIDEWYRHHCKYKVCSTQQKQRQFIAERIQVCEQSGGAVKAFVNLPTLSRVPDNLFLLFYGIGRQRFYEMKKSLCHAASQGQETIDYAALTLHRESLSTEPLRRQHISVKQEKAIAYITTLLTQMGDAIPNAVNGKNGGALTELPFPSVQLMWEKYQKEMDNRGNNYLFYTAFNNLFRTHFPNVRLGKKRGMYKHCSTCTSLQYAHSSASTVADKAKAKLQLHQHHEHVKLERIYYHYINDNSAAHNPAVMSLILDGMDQAKLMYPGLKNNFRPTSDSERMTRMGKYS
jgi:hypothetical protein